MRVYFPGLRVLAFDNCEFIPNKEVQIRVDLRAACGEG